MTETSSPESLQITETCTHEVSAERERTDNTHKWTVEVEKVSEVIYLIRVWVCNEKRTIREFQKVREHSTQPRMQGSSSSKTNSQKKHFDFKI